MRGELLPASRASLGLRTHNHGEREDERDKGLHPMAKPDNLFTNSWRNDQC